jgi:predicted phage gp36 major capsid-like protein
MFERIGFMSARLIALREKQGLTHDSMEALLKKASDEKRDLLSEEATVFDDLQKDFDSGKLAIEREEKVEKIKADLAKPVDIPGNNVEKVPASAKFRYGKLKAFKGETAEDDAYKSGMFFRAAIFRNQVAIDWCRENNISITKAQGETVGSSGGYLVPVQFNQAIIDLREEYGTFRQAVSVTPMGSDSMTIPRRAGGLTAYFPGENGAITESTKAWGQVTLNAKKIAVLTRMSTELSEDAIISIADDLASEMAYAFAQTEDSCGWNGDGTSTYGGITGIRHEDGRHLGRGPACRRRRRGLGPRHLRRDRRQRSGKPHGEAAEVRRSRRQVVLLAARMGDGLPAPHRGRWRHHMGELTGGKPSRSYLGYPVVIDQTLPTALTDLSDVAMLFFGDLSKAVTMGERRGIMVKTSEERYFEYDQIAIQATERVDINVHDIGDATTAGPIVALIGE